MSGARLALVIANDTYADPGLRALRAPTQDAEALARVLGDPAVGGFEVAVLRNETAQQIRVAVEDFFAERNREDLLLLHVSAHGLKNAAGELYLAARDTRPTRLGSTAVPAAFVSDQMADSRAQRIALFLDCCYGGAFPRGMVVRAAGDAQVRDAFALQDRVGGDRGRAVVTASSAMEYAFEGTELAAGTHVRPSLFTSAVVEGLAEGEADRDADGWVGLGELFSYVSDRVRRATPHQTPQLWTFGAQGDLLIARSGRRRVKPTPLPAELVAARESPLAATRFGLVEEFRDRLHGDDLGQALAAWQALQEMRNDDSRRVSEAASRALTSMELTVTPAVVDLGTIMQGTVRTCELRLSGAPLATAVSVAGSARSIRAREESGTVQVAVEPASAGPIEGTVVITGPVAEVRVPVRAEVLPADAAAGTQPAGAGPKPDAPAPLDAAAGTEASAPVDAAAGTEASAPVDAAGVTRDLPVRTEQPLTGPAPSRQPTAGALLGGQPTASALLRKPPSEPPVAGQTGPGIRRASWPATIVLVCSALVPVFIHLSPDQLLVMIWYDPDTGAGVYPSISDGYLLAAVIGLAGAVTARAASRRWLPALGVCLAVAGIFGGSAILILGSGMAYEAGRAGWTVSLLAALVTTVAVVVETRRAQPWSTSRFRRPTVAVIVVGALSVVFLVGAPAFSALNGDTPPALSVLGGWAFVVPLIVIALGAGAVASEPGSSVHRVLAAASVTHALLLMVVVTYEAGESVTTGYFLALFIGSVLLLATLGTQKAQRVRTLRPSPRHP